VSCWYCDRSGCPGSVLGECPEEKADAEAQHARSVAAARLQSEADEWYAAEVERMRERAPA
jgi:hypothetical protein